VAKDLYNGQDPRKVPVYSINEVAHHLRLPSSTVRAWVRSREGPSPFERVVVPDDGNGARLSFQNLVEIHVLSSLRSYDIPLPRNREAIGFMRKQFGTEHPLADIQLLADGTDIFAHLFDAFIAVTRGGQVALKPVIEKYLHRIERDEKGLLRRLYPFVDAKGSDRIIAIDPRRKFGRPYLVDAGVETSAIVSRHRAGESVAELARDFNTTKASIEGALRFENVAKKVA
jgi:uncharacterized protein (DUF433 family)